MTTTIYGTAKQPLVKRITECADSEPEFVIRKEDDPQYRTFVGLVDTATIKGEPVKRWKLYSLWFHSHTFKKHWYQPPTTNTVGNLIYLMFLKEMKEREIGYVVSAWMRKRGRTITQDVYREICLEMKRVSEAAAPKVTEIKEKRNAKRREKDKMKKAKIGRPRKTDGIRVQLLEALKTHPATPAFLTDKLQAEPTAVWSALHRMVKDGEVTTEHGMYSRTEKTLV